MKDSFLPTLPQNRGISAWEHEPLDYYLRCIIGKNLNADNNEIRSLLSAFSCLGTFLKSYKRGVIQYIFHSSSKEGWSCLQLGRVFKKVTHRNTDGMIKNVITNSAEYGLIPQRDFFDKDIAVEGNTLNYFVIEPGAFVYNPRKSTPAPYGPFNRYTLRESGIISPLYTCLVLDADIDPSYLAWYFKSDAWHRFIYDNGSQGVRHDRVSMTDDLLMSIPVAVPPADKQRQITQILDSVETLLLTAQKEYALLEKLYKGFLRQLFI